MDKLQGTLVYVMVDKPTDCYEKSKGQEWKAGIVVDEEQADAFDAIYPKQAAKKVKVTAFKDAYKIDPPEWADKNVWVITLRKNTKLANGEEVPEKYRPKVFTKTDKGTMKDITQEVLLANGSEGFISIDHYDAKLGAVARLKNILVTKVIEYVPTGSSYESGSEFDSESKPAAKAVTPKPKAKAPVSKSGFDDMDDDIPF